MKKIKLPAGVTRAFYKAGFQVKKHSPEILAVAGVGGVIATIIVACKATTKLSEITENAKNDIEKIHHAYEHPETMNEEYTEKDHKKDLTIVYTQTGIKLVKLYAPTVGLGVVSVGCLLMSNNILRKRNIALAAAYTAVDKSFKEYRGRVVERFGEALDKELRYNIKAKEVEEIAVDEDGNETIVKKTVTTAGPLHSSEYAKFFDCGCKGWEKNAEINLKVLRCQQDYANDLLRARGFLFLNDVYDMLGIPRTKAGQIVGWIYDEKNPNGDNFVDFGIYDVYDEQKRDFVNGHENVILLDFNVDGPIIDLI